MVKLRLRVALLLCLALVSAGPLLGAVKLHALFLSGAVLQQGVEVPVWGTAPDGEKVQVQIAGQTLNTTAADGKWMVSLAAMEPGGPHTLLVQGENTVQSDNILVGEVWIGSGQSNMYWPVSRTEGARDAIRQSSDERLRLFTVPQVPSDEPLASIESREGIAGRAVEGAWVSASPETVAPFSAIGYFFGRDLRTALGIPVGIIHTSWGGTPAEAWTPREALTSRPNLKVYVENHQNAVAAYPEQARKHEEAMRKHEEAVQQARREGKEPPKAPAAPSNPALNVRRPAALYNGMIAPLVPYAFRGAIWYQGESNAGKAYLYKELFSTMIQSWRDVWGMGDFPFLFVQLAPYQPRTNKPVESTWAELREAQVMTVRSLPNTGMAVITDLGQERDIHPVRKQPVAGRLALAAVGMAYGGDVEYASPLYQSMTVEGDRAILRFDNVDGGLVCKGIELAGFTIAGRDRRFHNAKAEIIGRDRVAVWSDEVKKPVAVRFGWADFPVVNLYSQMGLPASPFRTDNFPGITAPKS